MTILTANDRGHDIEIAFDQSRPEWPIHWREVGSDDWLATPHQAADAGMDSAEAVALVLAYLANQPA